MQFRQPSILGKPTQARTISIGLRSLTIGATKPSSPKTETVAWDIFIDGPG